MLARGVYGGRQVRARVLFSPRFISRTFPGGTGPNRTRYLNAVSGSPTTSAAYATTVGNLITANPVHVEITAVEDGRAPKETPSARRNKPLAYPLTPNSPGRRWWSRLMRV